MMGYVPPKPPSDPTATLYAIARIYDVGNQLLAASRTPTLTGYQKYIHDLYGGRSASSFMALNYGFLAALIALAVLIVWQLQ